MKLYFAKGACSLAAHIVMAELNMVYEVEAVDLKTKVCASGDFRTINMKGSVPALRMENGEILTEGAVILQYLADQKPESTLLPKFGTMERFRCLEMMNFISTELHKNYTPLFMTGMFVQSDAAKTELKTSLANLLKNKINFASEKLAQNNYLMGNIFTVADAYMFTVLNWSQYVNIDLTPWTNITAYLKRVSERPAVLKAMKEEGLI
jgi:glutathione S-transferase